MQPSDSRCTVDEPTRRRAAFHAPTGRLLVTHNHNVAHGTLDELEAFARFVMREVTRQRLKNYEATWPEPPELIDEF